MKLNAVLRECAADLLETEDHVTVEHVVACAYQRHGEAFAEEQERLVQAHARTIVAKLMRDLAEDENEQQTFGFGGLPSAIAIPDEGGTYYVRSDKATWEELVRGRAVRTANVAAAQAALDAYDETLGMLQPYMEGSDRSVAEAVQALGRAA